MQKAIYFCLFLFIIGIQSALTTDITIILQNGLEINGEIYESVEDVKISNWSADHANENFENNTLVVGREDQRVLIRFDISLLPKDTNVKSAILSLYCTGIDGSTPGTISLHRMTQPNWVVNKATWNKYDGINDWTAPGAEGDYDTTAISVWKPIAKTWAEFDVTSIIRNYIDSVYDSKTGFLLKSGASYDYTYFADSANTNQSVRPKLTIIYTSNAPVANAGIDQEVGRNARVALDGTRTTDPNQDPKYLNYEWSFLSKPKTSNLTDNDISPNNTTGINGGDKPSFMIDALGDYDIVLTVTNDLGLKSRDIVRITSFYVKNEHPRIWLSSEVLDILKLRAQANTPEWQALVADANRTDKTVIESSALVYKITGQKEYADKAIKQMLSKATNPEAGKDYNASKYYTIPLYIGFDWLYDQLSETDKAIIINAINEVNNYILTNSFTRSLFYSPTNVYGQRAATNIGLSGYATYGDNNQAKEWINEAMNQFKTITTPYLDELNASNGGAWPHSHAYGAHFEQLLRYIIGVKTATEEDLLIYIRGYAEAKIYYVIYATYPTMNDMHMFGETWKSGPDALDWTLMLLLAKVFYGTQSGEYAQWWLNQSNILYNSALYNSPSSTFIFYDRDAKEREPNNLPLCRYEPYIGHIYTRSDWTKDATWLSFESGPAYYVDHLHADNNQFTVYKHSKLVVETATYEPAGTAYHNSLLINGQGQIYPISKYKDDDGNYERAKNAGKIISLEDNGHYTYIKGDATDSYNTSKNYIVEKFTREIIFLRPDYIFIFDKVKTLQPVINTWRIHTSTTPQVNGSKSIINNGRGSLFLNTLLPELAKITVGESTYNNTRIAWKLDVENSIPQDLTFFLHAMYTTDDSVSSPPSIAKIQGDTMVGAQIADSLVLFSSTDSVINEVSYIVNNNGLIKNILCNMLPNIPYTIFKDGNAIQTVISSENGILTFDTVIDGQHQISVSNSGTLPEIPIGKAGKPKHKD
ncbi:MAG: DNRLRE domain-containing protein [bacterium]